MSDRNLSILFFCFLMSSLVGCTTYSKKQCETMNWHRVGYDIALKGAGAESKDEHFRKNCLLEHKVQPDVPSLRAGHQEGLQRLCTPAGGTQLGFSDYSYQGICPREKEPEFLRTYQLAKIDRSSRQISELKERVSDLESQINSKDAEISHLRSLNSMPNSCVPDPCHCN